MLRIMQGSQKGLKVQVFASLALAFSSFGDAFLYPFLPLNAEKAGVPLVWVGLLLSINRFVRLFVNQLLVRAIRKFSLRTVTLLGVLLALLSTAGYGLGWSLSGWIFLRILWGVSFSLLRTSMLSYGLLHPKAGLALGTSRGIYEAGPLVALFLGPILMEEFGASMVFIVLALLSLPAFYFASALPDQSLPPSASRPFSFRLPSLFNLITFFIALIAEGVLVVVLGLLLQGYYTEWQLSEITLLAASYLGFRRIIFMIFSPSAGFLADRLGAGLVFNCSVILMIVGLILLILNLVPAGLIVVFIFNSVNAAVAPAGAAAGKEDEIMAVAGNATWRDAGAAFGALAGGFLVEATYLSSALLIFTLCLTLLFLHYVKRTGSYSKKLVLWS